MWQTTPNQQVFRQALDDNFLVKKDALYKKGPEAGWINTYFEI